MHFPKVSIIIPCYNQGLFLSEALMSIEALNQSLLEVIIINDGSVDAYTNQYISDLDTIKYKIIVQANKGLSAARNTGIMQSSGDYIVLLDADNKIRKPYFEKGLEILETNPGTAVVYGNANFFGDETGEGRPGVFNLQRLMLENYIDACAIVRKKFLVDAGMYDEQMKLGWEDWDLWLNFGFRGYQFTYIDKICFDYRVSKNSMSRLLNAVNRNYSKPNKVYQYLQNKYDGKLGNEWVIGHLTNRFKKSPFLFLIKLIMKTYLPSLYNKLLLKNKIRNGL